MSRALEGALGIVSQTPEEELPNLNSTQTTRRNLHWFSALTLSFALTACQAPAATTPPVTSSAAPPAASPAAPASPVVNPAPIAPVTAPIAPTVADYALTGTAATAEGPMAGARVVAYPAGAVGKGDPLATATAGADGAFTLALGQAQVNVPVVVVASLGDTSLASVAMLTPEATTMRVLAVSANVKLSVASTLLYAALGERFGGIAKMTPSAAQVLRVLQAFQAALPAAEETVPTLPSGAIRELLAAIGANGTGRLTDAQADLVAPRNSAVAKAIVAAATDIGAVITQRLREGAAFPEGLSRSGFEFGSAIGPRVAPRSSGGGSSGSTTPPPVVTNENQVNLVDGGRMSVHPTDGSAWVLNSDGVTLTHRSATNQPVGSGATLPAAASSMEAIADGSVWVLTSENAALHYNGDGDLINTVNMADAPMYGYRTASVDKVSGDLWFTPSEAAGVFKIGPAAGATPEQLATDITHNSTILADPTTHGVWSILSTSNFNPMFPVFMPPTYSVRHVSDTGMVDFTISLPASMDMFGTPTITTDPSDGSLWVTRNNQTTLHFDATGMERTEKSGVTLSEQASLNGKVPLIDAVNGDAWFYETTGAISHFATAVTQYTRVPVGAWGVVRAFAVDSLDHTIWFSDAPNRLVNASPSATTPVLSDVVVEIPPGDYIAEIKVSGNTTWVLHEAD